MAQLIGRLVMLQEKKAKEMEELAATLAAVKLCCVFHFGFHAKSHA